MHTREAKGKEWVKKTLGWSVDLVERPKKDTPKEVLMAWAEQWLHEGGGARLAEANATKGVNSATEEVGGGKHFGLDLPQQEDE